MFVLPIRFYGNVRVTTVPDFAAGFNLLGSELGSYFCISIISKWDTFMKHTEAKWKEDDIHNTISFLLRKLKNSFFYFSFPQERKPLLYFQSVADF